MTNLKNQFRSKFAFLAILFPLSLIIPCKQGYSQGVGISNTAITPDPSAVLEMRSNNQGVLVPRMTTAQRDAIAAPADGLMIYNTSTQSFNYFQGGWKSFSGVTNVTGSGNISSTGGANPIISFTGNLPVTSLNSGSSASASTFWRGDGSWSAVDASSLIGNLAPARFNSGTSATTGTFWRGDGTWSSVDASTLTGNISPLRFNFGTSASTTTFWRGDGTWSSIAATTLSGILPVANGGTGLSAGISGGIPGFTAAGTLVSSPALTAKALLIGGGAGATPSSLPLGAGNQVLGMNSGGTDHEYKTINGTSNQIILTHGVNTITFSTPQNIHTAAAPTFAGLTLSGLNANAFVYSNAGKSINTTATPTNGQFLIGSTGAAPVVANLTAGNGIAITNGAGSVTVSNSIPVVEVSSSTAAGITTTSTSFLTAAGMSISVPADGDYMAWFSSSMSNSNNKVNNISLFKVDGQTVQQIMASERSSSTEAICATQAYIPNLIAGQLIDLRWKVAGGTGTMYQSTLTIMKVR